jgi:hypothetical protein
MGGLFSVFYGVVAFALFLFTIPNAIGFVGHLLVQISI